MSLLKKEGVWRGGRGGAGGIGSGCSCVAHLHWNSNGGLHFLACLCLLLDLNFLPALKMLYKSETDRRDGETDTSFEEKTSIHRIHKA